MVDGRIVGDLCCDSATGRDAGRGYRASDLVCAPPTGQGQTRGSSGECDRRAKTPANKDVRATIVGSHPVFPVPDLRATARYYSLVLGFRAVSYLDVANRTSASIATASRSY